MITDVAHCHPVGIPKGHNADKPERGAKAGLQPLTPATQKIESLQRIEKPNGSSFSSVGFFYLLDTLHLLGCESALYLFRRTFIVGHEDSVFTKCLVYKVK